jgi:hypothetical protein
MDRYITEHLTADHADRVADAVGSCAVVTRETAGVTYWYVVPVEIPRRAADLCIDSYARVHLIESGELRCRRCALPLGAFTVGDYHWNCVPVAAPVDPTLFETWAS